MATYVARRNLVEAPSTFELTDDRLARSEGGAAKQQVALGDVRLVRITYQPSGVVPTWVCSVQSPQGRISIPSANWLGVGRAEDQRAAFRVFVQALTSAVAAQPRAAPATFARGGSWMRPFFAGALIVFAVLGVLLALGAIGALMSGQSVTWVFLPTLTTLIAAQMSWRSWRGNPPAKFDPKALPADIAGS
jgi:hypothetical protein